VLNETKQKLWERHVVRSRLDLRGCGSEYCDGACTLCEADEDTVTTYMAGEAYQEKRHAKLIEVASAVKMLVLDGEYCVNCTGVSHRDTLEDHSAVCGWANIQRALRDLRQVL